MAVEDKYVNANTVLGVKENGLFSSGGATPVKYSQTFEVDNADTAASVFRIFKDLPPHARITELLIYNDAFGGAADVTIGLHDTLERGGAAVDANVFEASLSLVTAAKKVNGLDSVIIENLGKKLLEHAGETIDNHKIGYDLTITLATAGATGGTVTVEMELATD